MLATMHFLIQGPTKPLGFGRLGSEDCWSVCPVAAGCKVRVISNANDPFPQGHVESQALWRQKVPQLRSIGGLGQPWLAGSTALGGCSSGHINDLGQSSLH